MRFAATRTLQLSRANRMHSTGIPRTRTSASMAASTDRGFGSPTMPRGAPRAAQRAGGNATQRILQESPHIVTERLPIVGAPALWQAIGGHMSQLSKRSITKAIVVAALAAGVSG